MARRFHETLAMQRNAGIGEEVFDFRPGDRVMTVDGFPGQVVARNSGPYPGTEDYEVTLDGGMGGGLYSSAQLKKINPNTAALHEAAEVTASIPVEAITSHTADLDYPELGTILYDRLPNENVKLAAKEERPPWYVDDDAPAYWPELHHHHVIELHPEEIENLQATQKMVDPHHPAVEHFDRTKAEAHELPHVVRDEEGGEWISDGHHRLWGAMKHDSPIKVNYHTASAEVKTAANQDEAKKPQSSQEDPGQRMDQQEEDEEPDEDENNTDTKAAEEPADEAGKDEDDAGPPDIEQEKVNNTPDVTPPSACSFCGADAFEDPQMTGRGVRMRCAQCGGTMKSWGGQWEPEFPNSSQNHASGEGDFSQGGAAGVANAPGANFKTTKLQLEAGIINWIVDKIYDRIEERKQHDILGREWAWQTGMEGLPNYHTNYADDYCPTCRGVHPQTLHPEGLTVHGSLADEYDSEWGFHFIASWRDVQAKAKRIRKEGGVKILVATNLHVAGEVQGDHNVYETQLNYIPGSKHVADWACGCKWASYTWGRSPQYKRFEGRLCSHALALQYEANSRGMFGKEVQPDTERPSWQYQRSPVQVQYQRPTERAPERELRRRAVPPGNMRRTFSSLDTDGIYESPELVELHHAPIYATIQTMAVNGEKTENIIEMVASYNVSREAAKEMVFEAFHVDDEGIRRDGDEYETPDGDRFNHGTRDEDPDDYSDPEFVRANQRDLSDHDDDHFADEHKKKHHHTNDAREHAPHWGWGLPAGVPIMTCPQCNGSGCGHCAGQGQVVADANSASASGTPDQTSDAGDVVSGLATNGTLHTAGLDEADDHYYRLRDAIDRTLADKRAEQNQHWADHHDDTADLDLDGKRQSLAGLVENAELNIDNNAHHEWGMTPHQFLDASIQDHPYYQDVIRHLHKSSSLHTADYSSADPLAGVDEQTYYSPTNHSNSKNPASTGWATSEDPGDWGRSIITNNFGLTTDAALDGEPSVAGVLLRAKDTGRLLMIQRALSDNDPAAGKWEAPGGHLEDGEKPLEGAVREFEEETGHPFPQDAFVVHTWRSGPYRGHLVEVPSESHLDFSQGRQIENPDGDIHEHVAWWEPDHARKNPALRAEMKKAPWEEFKKGAGRHSPHSENQVEYSYERGMKSGYDDPTADAEALSNAHEMYNPGMKYHFLDGFAEGAQRRNEGYVASRKEAGGDKYTDTYYGGGSANEHRFIRPSSDECKYCARPLLPHEKDAQSCENCFAHERASDVTGGDAYHLHPFAPYQVEDTPWEDLHPEYHPERLHTMSTLVDDPDEVGALPYTTGDSNDTLAGQTGGSALDSDLPHASTDALHGDQGAHTIDSLHQAFLNSPGAQAMMADLGITKAAMKDFSYAEQQDLINEGQGVRARNFNDLKIAGTHYEHLKDDEDGDLFL